MCLTRLKHGIMPVTKGANLVKDSCNDINAALKVIYKDLYCLSAYFSSIVVSTIDRRWPPRIDQNRGANSQLKTTINS